MNLFWGFIIFYGFNFVIYDELMDANRYAQDFHHLYQEKLSFNSFIDNVFQNEESSVLDFGVPLLHFFLAIFTGNSKILFGVYAFIFGYFYTRNIWYIAKQSEANFNVYNFLFFALLVLIVPFWTINGFRFWTAFHIFIYAILPGFYGEKSPNRAIWMVVAVIFHFSFIIPFLFFLFKKYFPKNITVLYILYLFCFSISEINLSPIQDLLLGITPEIFHKKIISYTNTSYGDHLQAIENQTKWFVKLRFKGVSYFFLLSISLLVLKYRREIQNSPQLKDGLTLVLQLWIVFGFLANLPSMGRFLNLANFLFFALMIQVWSKAFLTEDSDWLKASFWVCTPLLLLFIVFQLRIGMQSMNSLVILGNPFLALFSEGDSLLKLFKD